MYKRDSHDVREYIRRRGSSRDTRICDLWVVFKRSPRNTCAVTVSQHKRRRNTIQSVENENTWRFLKIYEYFFLAFLRDGKCRKLKRKKKQNFLEGSIDFISRRILNNNCWSYWWGNDIEKKKKENPFFKSNISLKIGLIAVIDET